MSRKPPARRSKEARDLRESGLYTQKVIPNKKKSVLPEIDIDAIADNIPEPHRSTAPMSLAQTPEEIRKAWEKYK